MIEGGSIVDEYFGPDGYRYTRPYCEIITAEVSGRVR